MLRLGRYISASSESCESQWPPARSAGDYHYGRSTKHKAPPKDQSVEARLAAEKPKPRSREAEADDRLAQVQARAPPSSGGP